MIKSTQFVTKWMYGVVRGTSIWLSFNLIYIFLGVNLLLAQNINEVGTLIWTMFLLIPLVFSPGTAAALDCTRRYFKGEGDGVMRTAWNSFCRNYFLGLKHGSLFCLILILLYTCARYYSSWVGALSFGIFGILAVLSTLLFLFVLAYTVDRQETFFNYWKKSGRLVLNHPLLFFIMGVEVVLTIYFTHFLSALLLLVMPGTVLLFVMHFYLEVVKCEAHLNQQSPNKSLS